MGIDIKDSFNDFVTFLNKRINLQEINYSALLNHAGILSKLY